MRAFRGWFTQNKMLAIPALVGFAIWAFIASMVLLGGCATAPARATTTGADVTTRTVKLNDGTTVECVLFDPGDQGGPSGAIWCR